MITFLIFFFIMDLNSLILACLYIILFKFFGVHWASLIFVFMVFIDLGNVQPLFLKIFSCPYLSFPLGTPVTHKLGPLESSLFSHYALFWITSIVCLQVHEFFSPAMYNLLFSYPEYF